MVRAIWIFSLVFLFFIFLFANNRLNKKINLLKSISDPTIKDKNLLKLFSAIDLVFSFILYVYFIVVVFTIFAIICLLTFILFT